MTVPMSLTHTLVLGLISIKCWDINCSTECGIQFGNENGGVRRKLRLQ